MEREVAVVVGQEVGEDSLLQVAQPLLLVKEIRVDITFQHAALVPVVEVEVLEPQALLEHLTRVDQVARASLHR